MYCYFLLNIKHGASQAHSSIGVPAKYNYEALEGGGVEGPFWGPGEGPLRPPGGLQLSSAGTGHGFGGMDAPALGQRWAHRILKSEGQGSRSQLNIFCLFMRLSFSACIRDIVNVIPWTLFDEYSWNSAALIHSGSGTKMNSYVLNFWFQKLRVQALWNKIS